MILKKNILFINKDGVIGGSAVSLLLLLKKLKSNGYNVSVILCAGGPFEKELKINNIPYKIIIFNEWRKFIKIVFNIKAIIKLKNFIKNNNFDIVHANSYEVNPLAIFSKVNSIKTICHLRDVIDFKKAKKFYLDKSDCIITVSKFCKDQIKGINNNIKVVYNGINMKSILVQKKSIKFISAKDIFKVALIGNCEPRKAQDIFVKAGLEIIKKTDKFHFYIFGKNNTKYCREVKKLIKRHRKYFTFFRFKKNIYEYIRNIDVIVISSREEAFGRTAIEAMALKKAVVATNVNGLPEIIKHNWNGLLYPVDNYIKLSKYLIELKKNKKLYEKLSTNGFNTVKKSFTDSKYYENITKVYSKI